MDQGIAGNLGIDPDPDQAFFVEKLMKRTVN